MRLELLLLVHDIALNFGLSNIPTQPFDLLLHLGVFGALADALKIGFDFAFELEAVAARATLKRILYDIAP